MFDGVGERPQPFRLPSKAASHYELFTAPASSTCSRPSSPARISTGSANTENLQTVMRRLETEFASDALLLGLDEFVVELNDQTALRADQVVVMPLPVVILVAQMTVVELLAACNTALDQQLHRAVNSRESERRVLRAGALIYLPDGQVSGGFQKYFQDRIALAGYLVAGAFQMAMEHFFFFRHYHPFVCTARQPRHAEQRIVDDCGCRRAIVVFADDGVGVTACAAYVLSSANAGFTERLGSGRQER
jgi:hypothetical protein